MISLLTHVNDFLNYVSERVYSITNNIMNHIAQFFTRTHNTEPNTRAPEEESSIVEPDNRASELQAITSPNISQPQFSGALYLLLPYDSQNTISTYLLENESFQLSSTNKAMYKNFTILAKMAPLFHPIKSYFLIQLKLNKTQIDINDEIMKIKRSHPAHFIQSMGGLGKILHMPVMDIGNKMGNTGYLDFYVKLDMPVVRGIDCYNRCFYFAKASITTKAGEEKTSTFKIFQRYTDEKHWEYAGNKNSKGFIATDILEASQEQRREGSTATGDDRARLGLRGLTFFAQLVTKGEVGRPQPNNPDDIFSYNTHIPEKGDDDYQAVTLMK